MIRDLYGGLTGREQRALRWSAAVMAGVLWLSMAWVDPRFLLAIPVVVVGLWLYHRRCRGENPDDDPDFEY